MMSGVRLAFSARLALLKQLCACRKVPISMQMRFAVRGHHVLQAGISSAATLQKAQREASVLFRHVVRVQGAGEQHHQSEYY